MCTTAYDWSYLDTFASVGCCSDESTGVYVHDVSTVMGTGDTSIAV